MKKLGGRGRKELPCFLSLKKQKPGHHQNPKTTFIEHWYSRFIFIVDATMTHTDRRMSLEPSPTDDVVQDVMKAEPSQEQTQEQEQEQKGFQTVGPTRGHKRRHRQREHASASPTGYPAWLQQPSPSPPSSSSSSPTPTPHIPAIASTSSVCTPSKPVVAAETTTFAAGRLRFSSLHKFMHTTFPDAAYDAPCTILLFADVWDWPTLRFLQVVHSWSEMMTVRDQAAPDKVSQPWFHAFHVDQRTILNVHKRNVSFVDKPCDAYMDRLLSNLNVPYSVKHKLL